MLKNYKKLSVIGAGSFGKAWLVTHAENTRKMVCKEIKVSQLTEKESEQCITEVMVLACCNHGNIIRYVEAFVEKKHLYIVMEFAEGGDLQKKIFKQNGIFFAKEVILEWSVQIMMALEYIHRRNILHRDLKAQNVFLTGNDVIKLGDFGIAKVLQGQGDHAMTQIGTPFYVSPEIYQKKPYNSSSDMWAAGCLLYELCLLRVPFIAPDITSLILKILQPQYDPIPSYFGPLIEHLISSLLVVQPSSRLSASAALNIPEIQNIRDKLHSKHSDIYKCQNLGLAISNDKSKSNRVSVSACDDRDYNRFEKDSSITEAESKLIENRIERNALNKLALGRRLQRERIRSVHGVRSLTPDLRREHTHNVRRQQSEPRRYSCGDGEQSKSRNGIALENMVVDHSNACNNEQIRKEKGLVIKQSDRNKEQARELVEPDDGINHSEAAVTPDDSKSHNKVSSISKKTFVIKESALRRLSQVSPLLLETVRQQRAALSLDTNEVFQDKVNPPKAALFRNVEGMSENIKRPSISLEADSTTGGPDSSVDDVFETPTKQQMAGGLNVERKEVDYETGPFSVQHQKRIDSTTYVVKDGVCRINNNEDTEVPESVNEVLFLASSVSKRQPETAKDILNSTIARKLGSSAARKIVSMVNEHIDRGQGYETLVKGLSDREVEMLPLIFCLYNI